MKAHDLEQNSNAWHELRRGIPTASMFSNIITTKGERSKSITDCINEKAANVIAGETLETWQGNQWTERGHELEDDAVSHYSFIYDNYDVQKVGFVTNDDNTAGCSPDRLINDDGLLEIKCPMPKIHMAYLRANKLPTAYFQQVHGQMLITGRKWCDFMSYHPKLPALIIRVERDDEFCEKLSEQIKYFNEELARVVVSVKG